MIKPGPIFYKIIGNNSIKILYLKIKKKKDLGDEDKQQREEEGIC